MEDNIKRSAALDEIEDWIDLCQTDGNQTIKALCHVRHSIRKLPAAEEKSVVTILDDVAERICDEYCRFPIMYAEQNKDDPDSMMDLLLREKCVDCPLRLLTERRRSSGR